VVQVSVKPSTEVGVMCDVKVTQIGEELRGNLKVTTRQYKWPSTDLLEGRSDNTWSSSINMKSFAWVETY